MNFHSVGTLKTLLKGLVVKKLEAKFLRYGRGAFTNYVYKTRYVGGSKCPLFGNIHTIEKVNAGG